MTLIELAMANINSVESETRLLAEIREPDWEPGYFRNYDWPQYVPHSLREIWDSISHEAQYAAYLTAKYHFDSLNN